MVITCSVLLFSCSHHSHMWCRVMNELTKTVKDREILRFFQSIRSYIETHSTPSMSPPVSTVWPLVMLDLLYTTAHIRTTCDMYAVPPSPRLDQPVENWTDELTPRPSSPQRCAARTVRPSLRPSLLKRRNQRLTRFGFDSSTTK